MAITIRITGEKAGRSFLYELPKRKGRKKTVPTYWMVLANESGSRADVPVTRDTVVKVFGEKRDFIYGTNDECPPSRKGRPYSGHVRTDGSKGFRIELFEPGVGLRYSNYQLKGVGRVIREYIQIHLGPAQSLGCFCLTGGTRGRDEFKKLVTKMIREDKKNKVRGVGEFKIYVDKRN